jgi:hypothetical protein
MPDEPYGRLLKKKKWKKPKKKSKKLNSNGKESKQTGHLEVKKVTMYVHRVKIPLHRSATVQREKVVQYCELSMKRCSVTETSKK